MSIFTKITANLQNMLSKHIYQVCTTKQPQFFRYNNRYIRNKDLKLYTCQAQCFQYCVKT